MNAYQMPFKAITLVPGEDFSAKRYALVTVGADGRAVTATAKNAAIGIIQEDNGVDQPSNVMVSGVSFVKFDGPVAAGDPVSVGAGGAAKKATITTGTPDGVIVGICLVGGAAGEIGSIILK